MNVVFGHENLSLEQPTVATLGAFDGLHLGHWKIIGLTTELAATKRLPSLLITFDRLPRQLLSPDAPPELLTTLETKLELLETSGVDYVLVLRFDAALARLSREEFCDRILVAKAKLGHLVVGENFRFGAGATGDTAFLATCGQEKDFTLTPVPLETRDHAAVSSTEIRQLFKAGQVDRIPKLLGRYHFITGVIGPGAGRGAELGFPTANLVEDPGLCLPKRGVYIGYLTVLGAAPMPSVMNVGVNPTFDESREHCEIHILDFAGDLRGRRARVELRERVRDEVRFASIAALKVQIARDVDTAREYFRRRMADGGCQKGSKHQAPSANLLNPKS